MTTSISIVGLGGGGCKVVDCAARSLPGSDIQAPPPQGVTSDRQVGTAIVAVNTDSRELSNSCATVKLQIGSGRTNGLGTGGDASLGKLAADDDIEMLRGLFADVDLVFLAVGLGGGTGTGAAPTVLNAATAAGATTICFATLPFKFEGRQRRTQADQTVDSLREAADALIIVPNDRLIEFTGEEKLVETFKKADEVLAAGISDIWRMIVYPGFINLDFADLQKVVQNSRGICTFGYGEGAGKDKAYKAVTRLLDSPLLEQGRIIANARSLLVSIVGDPDLALKEVGDIMDTISSKARKDSHIFMGTVIDDDWRNKVTVTVIASDQWASERIAEPPAEEPDAAVKPVPGRKKRRAKQLQTKLSLESAGKGRFKGVEPTIFDGEDLDIPTFVRRGIVIEK